MTSLFLTCRFKMMGYTKSFPVEQSGNRNSACFPKAFCRVRGPEVSSVLFACALRASAVGRKGRKGERREGACLFCIDEGKGPLLFAACVSNTSLKD